MNSRINLLIYFLKKDLRARYAGSGLGMAWTVLLPVINIVLFWFVFSTILKARPYAHTQIPYIYFLLSSFFFWLAFSEGLLRASYAIVENAEMVKKVAFPNVVLPVTVTLSCYIHHMIGFLLFIAAFSLVTSFSPVVVLVIPVLVLQLFFSLGLGMLASALLPYMRDLGQVLGAVMQGLFFLSPIIYSIESIPEQFRVIFYFNPMTYFASSYHAIILMRQMPPLTYVGIIFVISFLSFVGGYYAFARLKAGFADVL
ncbi:MAG: ABC transporter permease [Chloroflexota bacterium]